MSLTEEAQELEEEEEEEEEKGEVQGHFPQLLETLYMNLASGDTGLSRELEAQRRLRTLSLDDKQEVNGDNLDMESLAMQEDWAHAASRFLQLLCTATEAIISSLSSVSERRDAAYRSYIKRASLEVVGIKPAFRDQAMQPFSKILNDLVPDEQRRQIIEKWVRELDTCPKGRNWESPRFTST